MSYSARRDAPSLRACSKSFLALLSSSRADAASTYSTKGCIPNYLLGLIVLGCSNTLGPNLYMSTRMRRHEKEERPGDCVSSH